MIDKEFYTRASLNNTFDLNAAEKALNDIQISSFQYLYEIQLKSTGIRRFDFNMGDLIRSERVDHTTSYYPRRWVYNIPENFIAHNKRLEYRKSKLYNQALSFQDVNKNPDIFSSTFLLFIEGKIYNNLIHLLCKEDKTILIFNLNEQPAVSGINKDIMQKMMKNNVRATFFMIPNHAGGSYRFNQYTFANYNNEIPLKLFGIDDNFKYEDKFMCTVTSDGNAESKICTVDNTLDTLYFLDNTVAESKFLSFTLDVFNLRHVFKHVDLASDEEWFSLDIMECPIATQNCIIMNDRNEFLHDVKLELYYPNVYHVVGDRPANTPLRIKIFYYDDTHSNLLAYHNHLAVYYKYVSNVLDKYKDGSILDMIKNYMPVECEYTINNFKETVWFDDHYKFKSEYLRELIHADGNNFIAYLLRQCKKPTAFYLDMSNIDLESRIRTDNKDVNEPVWIEEFNEPRYMFIFKNEFRTTFNQILFTIDGNYYIPDKHYRTSRYEFVYIPTDLIKNDSIMEVEKIKTFSRDEITTFSSLGETKEFEIKMFDDKVQVYHNDIFLTDLETSEYLEKEDYTVLALLDDEWIEINDDCFYNIDKKYRVKLNNENYINRPVKVNIRKNYAREVYEMNTVEDTMTLLTFSFDMNNDQRHIRMYKNGRVIPRHYFEPVFNANTNEGMSYMMYAREKEPGDTFIIECVPYKMKEVCYIRFIEPNKVIDLNGKIDKPLNLKWFDIYLNGRKLTKQNIEIISPCKFILRNVAADQHLSIVQNDRDENEWYGFYTPTDIIDRIFDIEDFVPNGDNEITEEEILGDEINTEEELLYHFWMYYILRYGFINPDWSQISKTVVKWYDPLFIKPNMIFKINPDRGIETATKYMTINPDVFRNNSSRS
jgi:hypothetical protein